MMSRLNELFGPDRKTRWRIILLSASVIAAWGMISEINGVPAREAENNATICGVLAFALQVCVYCVRAGRLETSFEWVPRFPRRLLLTTAGATILAALPGRTAERFVLSRRLRLLTQDEKLSPEQATEVSSALDIASAAAITLPDDVRVRVYRPVKSCAVEHPDSRPFVDAAGSIVRYTRTAEPLPNSDVNNVAGSVEARTAYKRGAKYALAVLSGWIPLPTRRPDDALKAIEAFTRTIELATAPEDKKLLSDALMERATMYLYLVQPNEVLRDAEAAESNGETDLSNIVDLEGNALLLRGGREDLGQAIRIFTLLSQLPEPTRVESAPKTSGLFHFDAYGNLGNAKYRLGEFEGAIAETERALTFFYENQNLYPSLPAEARLHVLRLAYLRIIASNLRLGKINDATTSARIWLEKSDDPIAQRIAFDLQSGHFDVAGFLKEYDGPASPLSPK